MPASKRLARELHTADICTTSFNDGAPSHCEGDRWECVNLKATRITGVFHPRPLSPPHPTTITNHTETEMVRTGEECSKRRVKSRARGRTISLRRPSRASTSTSAKKKTHQFTSSRTVFVCRPKERPKPGRGQRHRVRLHKHKEGERTFGLLRPRNILRHLQGAKVHNTGDTVLLRNGRCAIEGPNERYRGQTTVRTRQHHRSCPITTSPQKRI